MRRFDGQKDAWRWWKCSSVLCNECLLHRTGWFEWKHLKSCELNAFPIVNVEDSVTLGKNFKYAINQSQIIVLAAEYINLPMAQFRLLSSAQNNCCWPNPCKSLSTCLILFGRKWADYSFRFTHLVNMQQVKMHPANVWIHSEFA